MWYDSYDVDFKQTGALATVTPALAVQLVPWLSVGAAINIWVHEPYRNYAWKKEHRIRSSTHFDGDIVASNVTNRTDTFKLDTGVNATFGILVDTYKGLTLGAFYTLGFSTGLEREKQDAEGSRILDYRISFPQSYGFGLSYRFSDSLMVAVDYTRVEWDDFLSRMRVVWR